MTKIEEETNVYGVLDSDDEHLKELVDYICEKSYGTAYARFNENNELIGFSIDGDFYEIGTEDFASRMGQKIYDINKAVKDFEEYYEANGTLPKHYSHNHIKNHPRWIISRREFGLYSTQNEYLCPMTNVKKDLKKWFLFIWLSNGNLYDMEKENFDKKEYTYDEYMEILPKYILDSDKIYLKKLVSEYIETYTKKYGSFDFGILNEALDNTLAFVEMNEEFEASEGKIYDVLREINPSILNESSRNIIPLFFHKDLAAFMDISGISNRNEYNIEITLADDRFPIINYKGKKYDFRNSTEELLFGRMILKNNFSNNKKKKKKRR